MSTHNRRDFLKQSILAGATLGLGCSSLPLFGAKPGSKMRLGLVTYLWGQDWDLPTLIGKFSIYFLTS